MENNVTTFTIDAQKSLAKEMYEAEVDQKIANLHPRDRGKAAQQFKELCERKALAELERRAANEKAEDKYDSVSTNELKLTVDSLEREKSMHDTYCEWGQSNAKRKEILVIKRVLNQRAA